MSFSRVSLFGVLATTVVSAQRTDPTLGGEAMTFLGTTQEGQTFSPNPTYSLGPIPSSLAGFQAWRLGNQAEKQAGTDLTITCDNPRVDATGSGGFCEFFVSVHACASCMRQINGGLMGALRAEGWMSAQCASTFSNGAGAERKEGLKMQTVRNLLADGESVTVTTTDILSHLAIFQKKASFDCAAVSSDAASCNGIFACNFDERSGSCVSAFCPAPVGPSPPPACTCAVE